MCAPPLRHSVIDATLYEAEHPLIKGMFNKADIGVWVLAKSEKGFTDEEYKRFVSRMPKAMAICKLGYAWETYALEAMLTRPIIVKGQEPADAELLAWYQAADKVRSPK